MTLPWVNLACARGIIRVDPSIAEMALPRVHIAAFQCNDAERSTLLTVKRVSSLKGRHIDAPLGQCEIVLEGDTLTVQVGDGPFLGELVLRLAFYVTVSRQGGVLIHSSSVASSHAALVACGKSGDGKSTLSRLCTAHGLRLLTDEVVALFPDGNVAGTPFRSDADNVGSPEMVRARFFVALEKADVEALNSLAPVAAVQLAMSQCFDTEAAAISTTETRRRLLAFLSHVEVKTLSFRKHEDAGAFVAGLLE